MAPAYHKGWGTFGFQLETLVFKHSTEDDACQMDKDFFQTPGPWTKPGETDLRSITRLTKPQPFATVKPVTWGFVITSSTVLMKTRTERPVGVLACLHISVSWTEQLRSSTVKSWAALGGSAVSCWKVSFQECIAYQNRYLSMMQVGTGTAVKWNCFGCKTGRMPVPLQFPCLCWISFTGVWPYSFFH